MRVLLLQLPFFTLDTPSISLSLVKASLDRAGVPCDLRYLNLEFGDWLGTDLYSWVAGSAPPYLLFGDLVFTPALRGYPLPVTRLRELIAPLGTPGVPQVPEAMIEAYPALSEAAERFLREKLAEIPWHRYDLVGMGTMFQIVPALAFARMIKTLERPPRVILGGSNCESDMGEALMRNFPFIDYVARGEGENLIVELASHLENGAIGLADIQGLVYRDGVGEVRCNGASGSLRPTSEIAARAIPIELPLPPIEYELDLMPRPRYDDWMQQVRSLALLPQEKLRMPLETGRGCWFGEKSHCVFCGLNGSTLNFRRKSPERAFEDIAALTEYKVRMVHSVDDILDNRYFKSLLPRIAELNPGFEIFYETKANLSYEQVKMLHDAGIVWIQPGIESLSTAMLKLMRKGVTAHINIRLLRYAAEFGIGTAWNLLYGFPGEDPAEVQSMATVLPALHHLQPPYIECCQVRLHRFSPLFVERDSNGLCEVKPAKVYHEFYPFEPETVFRLAYYFEHQYVDGRDPNSYIRPVAAGVKEWHREVGSAAFVSFDRGSHLRLIDRRAIAHQGHADLRGFEREVLQACSHGATRDQVATATGEAPELVAEVLERFAQNSWVLHLDGKYLNLAVPVDALVPQFVPAAMAERAVVERYLARMHRIRQGFVKGLPSFDRLNERLRRARDPGVVPA
jgi:ribosomal peptide maturation radical SAM protein 1